MWNVVKKNQALTKKENDIKINIEGREIEDPLQLANILKSLFKYRRSIKYT